MISRPWPIARPEPYTGPRWPPRARSKTALRASRPARLGQIQPDRPPGPLARVAGSGMRAIRQECASCSGMHVDSQECTRRTAWWGQGMAGPGRGACTSSIPSLGDLVPRASLSPADRTYRAPPRPDPHGRREARPRGAPDRSLARGMPPCGMHARRPDAPRTRQEALGASRRLRHPRARLRVGSGRHGVASALYRVISRAYPSPTGGIPGARPGRSGE